MGRGEGGGHPVRQLLLQPVLKLTLHDAYFFGDGAKCDIDSILHAIETSGQAGDPIARAPVQSRMAKSGSLQCSQDFYFGFPPDSSQRARKVELQDIVNVPASEVVECIARADGEGKVLNGGLWSDGGPLQLAPAGQVQLRIHLIQDLT